jgi:hypothetical protein
MHLFHSSNDDNNIDDCAISIFSSSDSALVTLKSFFSSYNVMFILSKSANQAIDATCNYKDKLLITVVDTDIAGDECEGVSREIRSINYSLPILHYTASSTTRSTLKINPLLFDGHITDPLDRKNSASTLERAVLRRQAACRFLGLNFNHVLYDDTGKQDR